MGDFTVADEEGKPLSHPTVLPGSFPKCPCITLGRRRGEPSARLPSATALSIDAAARVQLGRQRSSALGLSEGLRERDPEPSLPLLGHPAFSYGLEGRGEHA